MKMTRILYFAIIIVSILILQKGCSYLNLMISQRYEVKEALVHLKVTGKGNIKEIKLKEERIKKKKEQIKLYSLIFVIILILLIGTLIILNRRD
jgi:hypothetical protein